MLTAPYLHFSSSQNSCLAIGSMSFDIRVKLTGLLISFSHPTPHFAKAGIALCSSGMLRPLQVFSDDHKLVGDFFWVVFSSIFSKAVGSTFDIIDVRISVMPKYTLLIDF